MPHYGRHPLWGAHHAGADHPEPVAAVSVWCPHYWPSVVASVLFLASLPLQGYYWLGKRADTHLPPSLREWYLQIHDKLAAAGAGSRHRCPAPLF
ncbi:DUF412 domain-containing protein [Oceanimonas sp. NS1]|nr:DUF412 domain-containing protein [Oceanimonas sp. NS1]